MATLMIQLMPYIYIYILTYLILAVIGDDDAHEQCDAYHAAKKDKYMNIQPVELYCVVLNCVPV